VDATEVDEMWSFVGKKADQRWLWHAIDHRTGKGLAYVLGRRKHQRHARAARAAAKAGQDMQPILVSVFGLPGDARLIDTYPQVGAMRGILRLPSGGRDTILPMLDQYARLLG
jgi:hypothetical protein